MNVFYTPDLGDSRTYELNEEESRHCVKVLRLEEGAEVLLVDGQGGLYTAGILRPDPKHCLLEIRSVQREYGKRPCRLHVAIAPTKNIDRFEWFLEKATEAGVDEITPLICDRSERRHLRTDRLARRITAAVKQSIRAYHPRLNEPAGFAEFLGRELFGSGLFSPGSLSPAPVDGGLSGEDGSGDGTLKFIAHCGPGMKQTLQQAASPGRDVLALIGPEGDFTPEEVAAALERGFLPLSLGESRLRTETAGLAVCFEMAFLNR